MTYQSCLIPFSELGLVFELISINYPHLECPPALLDLTPAPLTLGEHVHDGFPVNQLVINSLHAVATIHKIAITFNPSGC